MNMYAEFGPAMGSAARIFQAMGEGDENVPQPWLIRCRMQFEASSGLDYVSFALERLPELDRKNMRALVEENAQLSTYEQAERVFGSSMARIADTCNCKMCCIHGIANEKMARSEPSNNGIVPRETYCFLILASTIIRLVRELSGIDIIDRNLYLCRSGVEWFYNQQKARHKRQQQIGRTHNRAETELFVSRLVDYARLDKKAPEFSPLAIANSLFSGTQRVKDIPPGTSAIESQGICCYYRMLLGISRDARECARICVVPGTIESKDEVRYSGIVDFDDHSFKDTIVFQKADDRPTYSVKEDTRKLGNDCNGGRLKFVSRVHTGDAPDNALVPW